MDYQNLENLKVLTEKGFRDFESIIDQGISENILKVTFEDGSFIRATYDHRFLVDEDWVKCQDLMPGDNLNGKIVYDIEEAENERVYDFYEVEETHSYYSNGVISHNCNFLYIDEASVIPNNIADDFFTAIYPIISAGKNTKIAITSTPLGYNHFWKYWNDAEKGINGFIPLRVHYTEHPARDEKWAKEQKELLGEIKFNQEVLCVGGNTIITLRNNETGEILNLTIEEAYKICMESKYSILTPTGFQKFDGIIRNKKQSLLIKTRNGNSIETSLEHIFIVGGKEVKAKSLTPGDYITDKDRVVSSKLYKIQYLYDPVNVQNGNRYIGNGIIHHNCSFIGSSFTLISGDTLSKLSSKEYIWSRNDFNAIENPIPGHTYFIAVDTSEGVGGDNSAFLVIDITKMPYLTVGKFKCNTISYLLYPNIIQQFAKLYNNAFVLVEVNSIGNSVAQILYDELEYENILMVSQQSKDGQFLSMSARANYGVRTTKQVKRIGCQSLKTLIEEEKLIIFDDDVIRELSTFVEKKGSYAADDGYKDDLVMSLVLFSWATQDPMFKDITNTDTRRAIFNKRMEEIENETLPVGWFVDGSEEELDEFLL